MKTKNLLKKNQSRTKAAVCALLLVMFAALTGCGKKEVYTGGTQYPYEIEVASNGTMKVTLDGSMSPEHVWSCEAETYTYPQVDKDGYLTDPLVITPPVTVKQKGKEKKHKAVFAVKPVEARDQYSLVFVRQNAQPEEETVSFNSAGLMEESWEDVSARVSVSFTVKADEKGKLKIRFGSCDEQEMTGVVEMAKDSAYPYRYQIDSKNEFLLQLPNLCDWNYEMINTDEEGTPQADPEDTDEEEADAIGSDGEEQSESIDYSQIDDPALLAELQKLDAQMDSLKHDHISQVELSEYNMIPEPGQDPAWYQDQSLHIWKKSTTVASDLETINLKLFGQSEGYCRLTIESKLVGMKITFLLGCDQNGTLSVKKAEYEGGATAVEGVMSYENEDRTQDPEALAMEEGEVEGDTSEEGRLKAQKAREAAEAAEAAKEDAEAASEETAKEEANAEAADAPQSGDAADQAGQTEEEKSADTQE